MNKHESADEKVTFRLYIYIVKSRDILCVPKRKETKEKKKNSVDNTVVWLEMKRLLNKLEALGTEIRIE